MGTREYLGFMWRRGGKNEDDSTSAISLETLFLFSLHFDLHRSTSASIFRPSTQIGTLHAWKIHQ